MKGIRTEWTYETNLVKFNELTQTGMSAPAAALGTWTGEQAAAAGFKRVTVRKLVGQPGNYTEVNVLFHP